MRALTIGFLLIAATVACVAATFPVLDTDRQAVIVFEQRLDCVPVGPVIRVGRLAPDPAEAGSGAGESARRRAFSFQPDNTPW